MNPIFRFFFYLFGWKLEGEVPADLKKAVFAVAPHTTWKDFFVGLGARAALKRNIGFLGKEELFKGPLGFIFKWLGGTPVKRFEKSKMVESYVQAINGSEDKLFALAPEGTRKQVEKLRTGFYYMAYGAKIPIIRVGFDFTNKKVILAEPFMPSGNFEEDMKKYFIPFFKKIPNINRNWIKNYEENKF